MGTHQTKDSKHAPHKVEENEENVRLLAKQKISTFIESLKKDPGEGEGSALGKTNILLIGKTNTGKTLLCRSLFNKYDEGRSELVKFGESSTLTFVKYSKKERPYVVFDSRGFEIGSFGNDFKVLKKFIKKEKISVVFITADVLGKIESNHLKIYYELTTSKTFRSIHNSVYFIFTKCDEISKEGAKILKQKLTNPNKRGQSLQDTWKIIVPKKKIFFTSCDKEKTLQNDLGPFQCCEFRKIRVSKKFTYSCRVCKKMFCCTKCKKTDKIDRKEKDNIITYFCSSCNYEWKPVTHQENQLKFLKRELMNLSPRDIMNLLDEIDLDNREKKSIPKKVGQTLVVLISSTTFNGAAALSPIPLIDFPFAFSSQAISILLLAKIWEFPLKDRDLWKWFLEYMAKTLPFAGLFMITGIPKIALSILKIFVIGDEIVIPLDVGITIFMTLLTQLCALFVFVSLYHVLPKSVFTKLSKEQQKMVLELLTERVKKHVTKEIIMDAVESVKKREEIPTDFFLKPMSLENFGDEMVQRGFTCSLSLEMLKDPVIVVETGQIYEKNMIEKWFETNDTCPNTQTPLVTKELKPHEQLKELIEFWNKEKRVELFRKLEEDKKTDENPNIDVIEIEERTENEEEEVESLFTDTSEREKMEKEEEGIGVLSLMNDEFGEEKLQPSQTGPDSLDVILEDKIETYVEISLDKYKKPVEKEVDIVIHSVNKKK